MSLQQPPSHAVTPDGNGQPYEAPPSTSEGQPNETVPKESVQIVGRAMGSMDRSLRALEEAERRLQVLLRQLARAQKRSRRSLMIDAATIGLLAAVTAFLTVLGLGLIAYLVAL